MKLVFGASILELLLMKAKAIPCIKGSFDFKIDGECSYENALKSFSEHIFSDPINVGHGCTHTAEDEFQELLGDVTVRSICEGAWDSAPTVAFDKIAEAYDGQFEQLYYNGKTHWNLETETKYEDPIGTATNILAEDAANVYLFYEDEAQTGRVEMPKDGSGNALPNFASCANNAIFCCWPRDRQANDNNGNCAKEYDVNCVNKDPADNTDLCYVDFSRAAQTMGFSSDAYSGFPFDNNEGEGAIHCHGLAWSDDPYDVTSRYMGNNLFYISMYDHMSQRGYVENIPGAPMCACAEQMPVVSRSDCTELAVDETYEFLYSGSDFSAILTKVEIDFNACQGWNGQNNDLWAYMQRLYYSDKKVSSDSLAGLSETLVEDNNCRHALSAFLYERDGLVIGHHHDVTKWTQVAGRDSLLAPSYGIQAFKAVTGEAPFILLRKCATCPKPHDSIYYKRITPVPASMNLLNELKNRRSDTEIEGNRFGVDFELYSTLADATYGTNKWVCTYRPTDGFPGDCAPNGSKADQDSRFESPSGKTDVGWYASYKPENALTAVSNSMDIGEIFLPGQTLEKDGAFYMSASGSDIWYQADQFHYMYEEHASGDFIITTDVLSIEKQDSYTKACIMVRDSLDTASAHFSMCLAADRGVQYNYRPTTAASATGNRDLATDGFPPKIRLRVVKRGLVFRGYWATVGSDDWVSFFDPKAVVMDQASIFIGLALTAKNAYRYAEAVFTDYVVESVNFAPFPTQPSSIPPSRKLTTNEAKDIGDVNPAVPGSSYITNDTGDYFVNGAGSNVFNMIDGFHFAFKNKVNGNFEVTALLSNFYGYRATEEWAKAGIMIRETLDANSTNAYAFLNSKKGAALIYRNATGVASEKIKQSELNMPNGAILKLVKRGNLVTAYESYTDVLGYRETGRVTIPSFSTAQSVYIGLGVTSKDKNLLATAVFKNFTITELQ